MTPNVDLTNLDEEAIAWATVGLVIQHLDHNEDRWDNTVAGLVCPLDDELVVPSPAYLRAGGVWPPEN